MVRATTILGARVIISQSSENLYGGKDIESAMSSRETRKSSFTITIPIYEAIRKTLTTEANKLT